jgi:hypothetical protein
MPHAYFPLDIPPFPLYLHSIIFKPFNFRVYLVFIVYLVCFVNSFTFEY